MVTPLEFRRFIASHLIQGIIISTTSFELIVHIPDEYDYHYVISDYVKEFIFYIYFSKQFNSKMEIKLVLAKTELEFIGNLAVKENNK